MNLLFKGRSLGESMGCIKGGQQNKKGRSASLRKEIYPNIGYPSLSFLGSILAFALLIRRDADADSDEYEDYVHSNIRFSEKNHGTVPVSTKPGRGASIE